MIDWELTDARAEFAAVFTSKATVLRKSSVADSSGGFVDAYTPAATYPCAFTPYQIRPREVESSERIQSLSYWQFAFPFDADIRLTDRLRVGTRVFEVAGSGSGTINVAQYVIATEIL